MSVGLPLGSGSRAADKARDEPTHGTTGLPGSIPRMFGEGGPGGTADGGHAGDAIVRSTENPLRVVEVCDDAAFEALEAPWNRLAANAPGSVFLRHEWFRAAWAWRRIGAMLWILCVFSGSCLVGVMPLLRAQWTAHGGRQVRFLTVPDTQWCDLLVARGRSTEVGHALVEHLISNSAHWDTLHLDFLPPRSEVEAALTAPLTARGVRFCMKAVDCNLVVPLGSSWQAYYHSRSRSLKKSCNLAANRLAGAGELQLTRFGVGGAAGEGWQDVLHEVVSISARSWKHADTANSLDRAGPRDFIQKLTEFAVDEGWLLIWRLRLQGRPIAMEYQLVYEGKVHALRSDFDQAFQSVSPGTYLNRRMLEALFSMGLDNYYMGRGSNPYKKRWSDAGETVFDLTAYAPTLAGQASRLWSNARTGLHRLYDRLASKPADEGKQRGDL